MTEGGISSWKKKEGESFSAGDVILEIVRTVVTMLFEHLYSWYFALGNGQGNYGC